MALNLKRSNPLGEMNLTPMIDTLFFLLVFFLVAAGIEEDDRSLEVKLPQASEALPMTVKPREMFVTINAQGRTFTGGQYRSLAEVEQLLQQAATDNPGRQTVIIRADERCSWRHVVDVMNLCAKARIRDVRTTTAEPTTRTPATNQQ